MAMWNSNMTMSWKWYGWFIDPIVALRGERKCFSCAVGSSLMKENTDFHRSSRFGIEIIAKLISDQRKLIESTRLVSFWNGYRITAPATRVRSIVADLVSW
jgi:hypothetical protein